MTTARGIMAIGKRFTTRLDIPYITLPRTSSTEATSGIGDVSARLLGYKILQSRRSAMLASVEVSFPTAQSPLLGTGRNIITPVIAYSFYMPKRKAVLALTYQDYFSFGGDESRAHIRWSRIQLYHIHPWSRRVWTLVLPELYYDHADGGYSMNVEATGYYRMSDRFAVWLKGGAGLFGDHPARYDWTVRLDSGTLSGGRRNAKSAVKSGKLLYETGSLLGSAFAILSDRGCMDFTDSPSRLGFGSVQSSSHLVSPFSSISIINHVSHIPLIVRLKAHA